MFKLFASTLTFLFIASCSLHDAVNIAVSRNPAKAIESIAKHRPKAYAQNPNLLLSDLKKGERNFKKAIRLLGKAVGREWGGEAELPSKKRYVKYTQNYKSRALVDFDKGIIRVETLSKKAINKNLKNAIITTLLTPQDPRSVDLFTDKEIKLSGRSYLYGLVRDNNRRFVDGPISAGKYADWLIAHKKEKKKIKAGGRSKTVTYTSFRMVKDYMERSARKYDKLASRYSKKFGVSKSLILGVIKTESNFNPYAVSPAPAYGLMQLVPRSGGREAYRKVKGVDKVPSKEYLFNPKNNIELGSAYLSHLWYKEFKQLGNQVSREYCVISAYNTGAGNVLKTFSRNKKIAINKINSMEPPELYKKLRTSLPYRETRDYLKKVVNNRKRYITTR